MAVLIGGRRMASPQVLGGELLDSLGEEPGGGRESWRAGWDLLAVGGAAVFGVESLLAIKAGDVGVGLRPGVESAAGAGVLGFAGALLLGRRLVGPIAVEGQWVRGEEGGAGPVEFAGGLDVVAHRLAKHPAAGLAFP